MDLAKRDLKVHEISKQIKLEQIKMLKRFKTISDKKSKNKYLDEIYTNYKKYRDDIISNKENQLKHIKLLLNYLKKMKKNEDEDENLLSKMRLEEKSLLKKILDLKYEIKIIKKETKSRRKK